MEYSKNVLLISKTRLEQEWSSPAVNKHTICKISNEKKNRIDTNSCKWCVHLVFSQRFYFFNSVLVHSRSDLVFKHPRLRNKIYFQNALLSCVQGMHHLIVSGRGGNGLKKSPVSTLNTLLYRFIKGFMKKYPCSTEPPPPPQESNGA